MAAIKEAEGKRRRRFRSILGRLHEAKQCLDALGVSLVEVEVTETTTMAAVAAAATAKQSEEKEGKSESD